MRYHESARALILHAGELARQLGHSYVGTMHLLLAISRRGNVPGQLLQSAGFDPQLAVQMVSVLYGVGTPGLPLPQGLSAQARRVLRGAGSEAKQLGCREVDGLHILLSLLRSEKTAARDLLILSNVDCEDLFTRIVELTRQKTELHQKKGGGNNEAVGTVQRGSDPEGSDHGTGDRPGKGDRYGHWDPDPKK